MDPMTPNATGIPTPKPIFVLIEMVLVLVDRLDPAPEIVASEAGALVTPVGILLPNEVVPRGVDVGMALEESVEAEGGLWRSWPTSSMKMSMPSSSQQVFDLLLPQQ